METNPQDIYQDRPQRSSSYMALRPPGARRRKYTYPGETDEEESPPRKRRNLLAPLMTRTGSYTGPTSQPSPTSSANALNRDKTPPFAGKRCEGCGATSTPQWRRGPSGKRTLCNACGVKWTFGRLKPNRHDDGMHSDHSSFGMGSDDEDYHTLNANAHDNNAPNLTRSASASAVAPAHITKHHTRAETCDPPISTRSDFALTAPTTHALHHEIQTLRMQLRESEMSRKRMREMLDTAVTDDSEMDRSYRRAVAKCRARRGSALANGSYLHSDNSDASAHDGSSASDDEDRYEETAIGRFVNAVKMTRGRNGWSGRLPRYIQ